MNTPGEVENECKVNAQRHTVLTGIANTKWGHFIVSREFMSKVRKECIVSAKIHLVLQDIAGVAYSRFIVLRAVNIFGWTAKEVQIEWEQGDI